MTPRRIRGGSLPNPYWASENAAEPGRCANTEGRAPDHRSDLTGRRLPPMIPHALPEADTGPHDTESCVRCSLALSVVRHRLTGPDAVLLDRILTGTPLEDLSVASR